MDKQNKNPIEDKILKDVEIEYDKYLKESSENQPSNLKTFNTTNIMSPIIKILLVFIITLSLINFINNNKTNNILEYIDKIEGTWIDEYDNHYEINSKKFQMNSGIKDLPFYEGEITNIIKTEKGFKILIKGTKYNLDIENRTKTEDKKLDISLEILEYVEENQKPMKVNMNKKEFSMIKVE